MKTSILSGICLLMSAFAFSGCFNYSAAPKPSKVQVTKKYSVDAFDQIKSTAPASITFTQGSAIKVEAEGPENYVERLRVTVKGKTLHIDMEDKLFSKNNCENLKFTIVAPNLNDIDHYGVGNFTLQDKVKVDELSIELGGVGNVQTDELIVRKLEVESDGVGSILLSGKAQQASYEQNGVGSIKAKDMEVSDLTVEQNGVGSVTCYASGTIRIDCNGVGSVDYYGDPQVKQLNKSGVGSINKK